MDDSASDSPPTPGTLTAPVSTRARHDGWTTARQVDFLDALARTRSASAAARVAGMSRESAYRLRKRPGGALFAAIWDLALAPEPVTEGHTRPPSDGRLMRLLGNSYRREAGDFAGIGTPVATVRGAGWTGTM